MNARDRLRHLDVVLTAGCNLSCSYCYQNAKQPGRNMDWETLQRAIDLLLASRAPERTICFYGGEPLLQFDLIRRGVEYMERRTRTRRIRYSIITNGTLMRGDVAEFLAAHRFDTQLSFDGVAAAQVHRGDRTFPVLDGLLDRLRRDHPVFFADDLYVLTTLLPSTVQHLADSFDYFADKGLERICISPKLTNTADWRLEQIDELDRQFGRIFERCLSHFEDTGGVLLDGFRKQVFDENVHAPDGLSMCGVSTGQTLCVDVDGEVFGCVTFAESFQKFPSELMRTQLTPLRMGPIDGTGFSDALQLYPGKAAGASMLHDKQDKYSAYGKCKDCRYLATCAICPASIGHIPGNADPRRVPDFLCAFSLILQRYRGRFPAQLDAIELLTGQPRVPRMMQALMDRS